MAHHNSPEERETLRALRQAAKARGDRSFDAQGIPCIRGHASRRSVGGHTLGYCSECRLELRHSDPTGRHKRQTHESRLRRAYGMTRDQYDEMIAAQGRACAICRLPFGTERRDEPHVDHCHDTGIVRGILCRNCNLVLGQVRYEAETLLAAADYIRRFQAMPVAH